MRKGILFQIALFLCMLMLAGCGSIGAPAATSAPVSPDAAQIYPQDNAGVPDHTATMPPATPSSATEMAIRNLANAQDKLLVQFFSLDAINWGDATFVCFPDRSTMMIDVASANCAQEIVERLMSAGVENIDRILITHLHSDHYGGLEYFLEAFEVETVYINGIEHDGEFEWENSQSVQDGLESMIQNAGAEIVYLMAGDALNFGDVHIDVLYPSLETAAFTINDASLVFRMEYGLNTALFTSDLYYSGEAAVLNEVDPALLDCDMMKIPHHGKDTSGSERFIQAVTPVYAVAMGSVRLTNLAASRYKSIGCTAMETCAYGDVWVMMDGTQMTCTSQR